MPFAIDPVYYPFLRGLMHFWYVILVLMITASAAVAAIHVVLNKRDVRAAIGWVGIILLVPLVGTLLYSLFGINRIQRRANALFGRRFRVNSANQHLVTETELAGRLEPDKVHLLSLHRLVQKVSRLPLVSGNLVEPLRDGDEAYPAMLKAIAEARSSISLCTYIFDFDRVGLQFVAALKQAMERGVDVRILLDAVGSRYSSPPIHRTMQQEGLQVALFMRTRLPWGWTYANLRNHRKLLIVDGTIGFTGGMNIREGHMHSLHPIHPVQDLHFRLQGPIVGQLQETFCEDWSFATGNPLEGKAWFPDLHPAGDMVCRGLNDGPDEDFEHIRWAILGAIASAESSIRIISPYFLPEPSLISALNVAAMRGLAVEILLPQQNNLRLVEWASQAHYGLLLHRGCRIYETPSPFDHTKLMIVDSLWVMFGSANWDPRSLRLNFEFNVACYDRGLAQQMEQFFAQKREQATPIDAEEERKRPLAQRIRNGFARLLSPYL